MNYFEEYTIKKGDTLSKIAKNFNTTVNSILTANPDISLNEIIEGDIIVIPYNVDIVDTNINYTYDVLVKDLEALKEVSVHRGIYFWKKHS